MLRALSCFILLAGLLVPAQTKPDQSVKLSEKDQLAFRDLQLKQARTVLQMQNLQIQIQTLSKQNDEVVHQLQDFIANKARELKIEQSKYTFDPDKLEYVANPPPAKP